MSIPTISIVSSQIVQVLLTDGQWHPAQGLRLVTIQSPLGWKTPLVAFNEGPDKWTYTPIANVVGVRGGYIPSVEE